ncbi:hypothetical protein RJ639_024847 [Escallonia herrerae]|uniref:Pectinesterase n=1 Tax=Escallonia herrerae TaxID=1293975 RepID=A0AA88UY99_9ASTE|nr:hypothetical protein RJ639_024847 [Escallonia herrerae]
MASEVRLHQVILCLISLSNLSLSFSYRKKAALEAVESAVNQAQGTTGLKALDVKLMNAETNKVRISVSQNGSEDFKTIQEALNSIPLPSVRREILDIRPGVYRTQLPMRLGGGQAVDKTPFMIIKAAFYNCSFYGAQDTLYDHKGLHYFNNCFVQGSVDFIFGYADPFTSRVYYGEYMCTGPGANLSGRVSWVQVLTEEEAKPFMGTYYIDGET